MRWGFKRPFITLLLSMLFAAFLPLLLNNLFYLRLRSTMLEQQAVIAEEAMRFNIQQVDSIQRDLILFSTRLGDDLKNTPIPAAGQMDNSTRLAIHEMTKTLSAERAKSLNGVEYIYLWSRETDSAVGDYGFSESADEIYQKFYGRWNISGETMEQLHDQPSRGKILPLGNDHAVFLYTISRNEAGLPERQLVCLLKRGFFKAILDECVMEGSIFFLTNNQGGTVLAVSNQAGIELEEDALASILTKEQNEKIDFQGQEALLCTVKGAASGSRMTAIIPSSQLLSATRALQWYYWTLMGASLMLALVLAVFFSRRNISPLNQLISYIRKNFGEKHPDSKGLEQIKDAVDSLLEQQNADRERLFHYETLTMLNDMRESFRGNVREGKLFQIPEGCRYVVVRFSDPQAEEALAEREIAKSLETLPPQGIRYSLLLDGSVIEILGRSDPDFNEEKVKELLTTQIDWLDQRGTLTVSASFSQVYEDPQELERAYEEACIAAESTSPEEETVIVSFSSCKLQASRLLRDWHHLDKQLQFSELLYEEDFKAASELLPALFPIEFLEELFSESDISRLHLDSLKYQFLHDLDGIREFSRLDDEEWNHIFQEVIYCKTHRKLYQVMERLCAELSEAERQPMPDALDDKGVEKVKRYIRGHYADPQLSVSSIAEAFGLSANALSQLFSRKSDHGVLDYIHETRMKKAAELLLSRRELTIQAVAEQVGYTSILTFNRKFKAAYGKTAGEYRKGQ